MNIEKQIISTYNEFFNNNITDIKVVDRCYEKDKRHYAFITDSSRKKIVIKCYKNSYNTEEKVEGYGYLAKVCKESGINVPLFYKTKENRYHTYLNFNSEKYLVWCEEFLPYETLLNARVKMSITSEFFYSMGEFVGRIHSATKSKGVYFPWNSSMVLFEGFCQEDEFDENFENAKNFYETLIQHEVDKKLLDEIWNIYNKKRKQIREAYDKLPKGGVQGDLSPNNIMVDEKYKPIAIIDFNQSGNDVYVNDMMQWAVYLVYGYLDEEVNTDIAVNLQSYFNGYTQNYTLQKEEIDCINNLYNIIRPFRYEKVELVLGKAKEGNITEVNKHLKWVLYELTRNNIVMYLNI